MTERKFTVIKGGGSAIPLKTNKKFVSAFVTDTRLMGVLGLSIHWEIKKDREPADFYQFFYYDAEEYGLETYRSLLGDDETALTLLEKTLMGGLGGVKVGITEKEARFLVQRFAAGSKKLKAPLPDPKNEYAFLLEEPVELTAKEKAVVLRKICTPIRSDYHLIHYFLMRLLAQDFEGMSYLTKGKVPLTELCGKLPATLCKNTVSEFTDETTGQTSYLCEALVELESKYKLLVLEVTVEDGKVASAVLRSGFFVTPAEAAMMLNRPEFVTVYEILTDPESFDSAFAGLTVGTMQTSHNNGRLFLEFNQNNDHVNRKVFRLNEDIHGLYFVSDFGQLLVASYSLAEIHEMEQDLQKSPLATVLLPTARYEFKEPILYEFIQSDYEDFSDFLNSLQE